jgi:hypothetical protein
MVFAVAAGVCDALKIGDNAKAGLMTRAVAEMVRLGVALGGKPETFYGLTGIGDLIATSYGTWSRNRQLGERVCRGEPAEELIEADLPPRATAHRWRYTNSPRPRDSPRQLSTRSWPSFISTARHRKASRG